MENDEIRVNMEEVSEAKLIVNDMDRIIERELTKIREEPIVIQARVHITGYQKLNSSLKKELKPYKRALDTKYKRLSTILNCLQISIIVLSTLSGFLQATKTHTSISDSDNTFIGIFVSTYTSFLLALIKYKKWDEKKEKVNNLKEKFAEFIVEIERMDDTLNYWCSESFWVGTLEEREKRWKEEVARFDEWMTPVIEKKQDLVCQYEQIMDKIEVDILNIRERNLERIIKTKQMNLLNHELIMKRAEDEARFEEKKQEIIYDEIIKHLNNVKTASSKEILDYDFHQMERLVKGKNPISKKSMLKKVGSVFQTDNEVPEDNEV